MNHSRPRIRGVAILLLGAFLLEMFPLSGICAVVRTEGRVENVRAERDGAQVIITYDLTGPKDESFTIAVTLKREDFPLFKFTPKNLSGDVGDDIVPGYGKKIIWEVAREIPSSLTDDVFYFLVEATSGSGGMNPLVWIGGGAAVVGGAAFLFLSKKGSDAAATSTQGFPSEPARPK